MSPDATTPCYIARTTVPTDQHPIPGTVAAATVDDGKRAADVANEVAGWVRDGLAVERVPVWWVRLHWGTTAVYRAEVPAPCA